MPAIPPPSLCILRVELSTQTGGKNPREAAHLVILGIRSDTGNLIYTSCGAPANDLSFGVRRINEPVD